MATPATVTAALATVYPHALRAYRTPRVAWRMAYSYARWQAAMQGALTCPYPCGGYPWCAPRVPQ